MDLLAVQGILKSLPAAPQFESINSSVLTASLDGLNFNLDPNKKSPKFPLVSEWGNSLYMTTGKTITVWTFVGKVMSTFKNAV